MARTDAMTTAEAQHYDDANRFEPQPLFDVTCTIGSVWLDDTASQTPVEAALAMIGRHAAEGQYRFPHEDDGEWIITVERKHTQEGATK